MNTLGRMLAQNKDSQVFLTALLTNMTLVQRKEVAWLAINSCSVGEEGEDDADLPCEEFRESIRKRHHTYIYSTGGMLLPVKHPKIEELAIAPDTYRRDKCGLPHSFNYREGSQLFQRELLLHNTLLVDHPYHFMVSYNDFREAAANVVIKAYLFPDEFYDVSVNEFKEVIVSYYLDEESAGDDDRPKRQKCTESILQTFVALRKQSTEFADGLRKFLIKYNLYVE